MGAELPVRPWALRAGSHGRRLTAPLLACRVRFRRSRSGGPLFQALRLEAGHRRLQYLRQALVEERDGGWRPGADGGGSWQPTALGRDEGTYSFRQWSMQITAPHSGTLTLQVRCTNTKGEVQPSEPNWNGGGFMRNAIERVRLTIA